MTNIPIPNTVDGYGANKNASISQDGRFIVYTSQKISELPTLEFQPLGRSEILLFDTVNNSTTIVSANLNGGISNGYNYGAVISDDGKFIAYVGNEDPDNSNQGFYKKVVYLYDVENGTNTTISNISVSGFSTNSISNLSISADGQYISYQSIYDETGSGYQNGSGSAYVYDAVSGEISIVAIRPDGTPSPSKSTRPEISADGSLVVYDSFDADLHEDYDQFLKQVFVSDIQNDTTSLITADISPTDFYTNISEAKISEDGTHISTVATTGVIGAKFNYYAQIYIHNTKSGISKTVIPQVAVNDLEPNNSDLGISHDISANGAFVVYDSSRNDITDNDTNGHKDIFVHNLISGQTALVSVSTGGTQANGASFNPTISADGQYISFNTAANNLVSGDTNVFSDIVRVINPLFGSSGWNFGWLLGWNYEWRIGWGVSWNVSWYSGWGVGWHSGWHLGWFWHPPGWEVGWYFGWFVSAGGTWNYGWNFGWYFNSTSWFYGWSVGWFVGWNIGSHYGWNLSWNWGWNLGWYLSWGLGWSI